MKTAMHDPKFEKAVQDKMEQLEFIPSDSVWENIEIAVAPRRRRAVPVFFWFLSAGLLLAGAGTAIYLRTGTHPLAKNVSIPAGAGDVKNAPPSADISHGKADPVPAEATAKENAPMPADALGMTHTSSVTDQIRGVSSDGRRGTTASRHPDAGLTADETAAVAMGSSIGGASATNPVPATDASRQHSSYQPGLISCVAAVSGIRGPRLSPWSGMSTAVTGIPMPKRPWAAGFAGGFGVSSYNESLLSKAPAVTTSASALSTSYSSQSYPTALTAVNSGTTSSKKITSSVQPGLSYWAGVVAQKPLSARWSLSLGLDLHYYSSRLRVGGVVTTYSQSASALIGSSAIAPVQSYPYYSVGDVQVYTNRYYYLELPVAMQWQINRGRVLPLFLRGGVTLSRLMSSNGLYYNDHSAVYFKDNSVIQPMQVSFTSGLVATLPLRGIRMQAGPELQYGATTLLKGGDGNGHLLYGGLRVTVMR
jgi:hypothetical protein